MERRKENRLNRKKCPHCKTIKDGTPEFFTRNKSCADGLAAYCLMCRRAMEPGYRENAVKKLQARLDAHARRLAALEELFLAGERSRNKSFGALPMEER